MHNGMGYKSHSLGKALFPIQTLDSMVGKFLSPMNTNDRFYSAIQLLLDNFSIIGGFAFVFVAQDIASGKEYALKVS